MRRARRVQNCMIELPDDAFISLPCSCEHEPPQHDMKIHIPSWKKLALSKVQAKPQDEVLSKLHMPSSKKLAPPKIHTTPTFINSPPSTPSHSDQLEELQEATKYLKMKEQELRRKTEELRKIIKECEASKQELEKESKENTLKRFSKLKNVAKESNQSCTYKHEPAKQNLCSRCNAEIHENNKQVIVKEKGKQKKEPITKNIVHNDAKELIKKNIHNEVYNKVYNQLMTMQVRRGLLDRLNALVQPPMSTWTNWYWLRQLLPNPCPCMGPSLPPLRSPFTACSMGTPRRCCSNTPSETNQSMQAGDCKTETLQQQVPYEVLSHGLLLFAATLAWFPCLCCVAACKCCFCLCCNDLF